MILRPPRIPEPQPQRSACAHTFLCLVSTSRPAPHAKAAPGPRHRKQPSAALRSPPRRRLFIFHTCFKMTAGWEPRNVSDTAGADWLGNDYAGYRVWLDHRSVLRRAAAPARPPSQTHRRAERRAWAARAARAAGPRRWRALLLYAAKTRRRQGSGVRGQGSEPWAASSRPSQALCRHTVAPSGHHGGLGGLCGVHLGIHSDSDREMRPPNPEVCALTLPWGGGGAPGAGLTPRYASSTLPGTRLLP